MNSDIDIQEIDYCEWCGDDIENCDCTLDEYDEDGMTDWEADCDTLENAYGYSEWGD